MSTRTFPFRVYDTDGAPLAGLTLSFASGASLYKINGTPATPPAVSEQGSGWYAFTVTLAAGEQLVASLDLGASSSSASLDLTVDEVELRAPLTAAEVTAAVPTAEEIAGEVGATLAAAHGSGAWGGAGSGSQSVTLTLTDGTGPISGVRVEAHDGARVVASGRTDTDGEVELLLDPGTYSVRCALAGYGFSATDVVVSAPDTATPDTITGAALPSESDGVVGLTRTLSLAATDGPDTTGVSGLVAGDSVVLARTFNNVPSAIARVRATWKRPADDLQPDADTAVVQLVVTSSSSSAGRVTDTGADGIGAATLILTPAQSLAIAQAEATDYDLQVELADGTVRTPELGTWDALPGRGSSTAP